MVSKPTPSSSPKTKIDQFIDGLFAYLQRQWWLVALVILYIFFCPTFESKLVALLQSFEPSWVSFIVWCGIIVTALAYTYVLCRRRYVISEGVLSWTAFLLLGWAYYRFIGVADHVATPTRIPGICYVDFLPFCGGCVIFVMWWSHRHRTKPKQEGVNNSIRGFEVECPCTYKDNDLLGRRNEAQDLAEKIFQTDTSNAAFTLGLTSPWGAGKTSFMLAMQKYLRDNHCSEIILLDFNPWMYRKAPNLTQIFFEELSRALAPYNSALASGFTRYVDHILAKDDSAWLRLGVRLLPQGFHAKSTSEQYDFLKKEIGKLGRKIVIFIDDVDRLDSEELIELFSLIRNSSLSFPYMSYIIAYDKEYVATQLQSEFNEHTYRYMEKIVQAEYPLAKITPEQLENALMDVLEKLSQEYPHLKEDIQKSGIQLEQHLPTLRAIKRIYNVLLSTPQDLRERIAHFDWFVIELIRIQYPLLFNFLKTKYTQAFLVGGDRRVVMKLEGEERNALLSEDTIEEEVVDFTQYLYKNQEGLGIENPNHILELMKKIWGKDRSNVIPQVNDWECIGRYFYRTMREGEFDIAQLHQYLSLPFTDGLQDPMKKIIPYVDGIHKSSYWKRFCSIIHEIDLKQEQTVNMLYLYFYILSLEKVQPHFSPKCDKWINSLREQDGKREKEILENLFSYPDIRKGVLLYISFILNRAEEVRIPFSSDELEAIKEKLFLEYTQDDTSIDPIDCYRLWFKCQTRYEDNIGSKVIHPIDLKRSSPKVNERMRDIITSNIERLIPHLIQESDTQDNTYKLLLPYPIWTLDPEEVTEKIRYFPDFISELDTSSSKVIKEFQVFFNEWYDYILKLKDYLENPHDQAGYHRLTRTDQAIITEWQMRYPEYLQSLQNNSRACFRLLRYTLSDHWGFISFKFNEFKPRDITIDRSKESSAIEL